MTGHSSRWREHWHFLFENGKEYYKKCLDWWCWCWVRSPHFCRGFLLFPCPRPSWPFQVSSLWHYLISLIRKTSLNCLFVGGVCPGPTLISFLCQFQSSPPPPYPFLAPEYIPIVFDDMEKTMQVNGHSVTVGMWVGFDHWRFLHQIAELGFLSYYIIHFSVYLPYPDLTSGYSRRWGLERTTTRLTRRDGPPSLRLLPGQPQVSWKHQNFLLSWDQSLQARSPLLPSGQQSGPSEGKCQGPSSQIPLLSSEPRLDLIPLRNSLRWSWSKRSPPRSTPPGTWKFQLSLGMASIRSSTLWSILWLVSVLVARSTRKPNVCFSECTCQSRSSKNVRQRACVHAHPGRWQTSS